MRHKVLMAYKIFLKTIWFFFSAFLNLMRHMFLITIKVVPFRKRLAAKRVNMAQKPLNVGFQENILLSVLAFSAMAVPLSRL